MIFGEGPIIKNIAGDLNKLFLQGTRAAQPIINVEGDAAADQGTADLLAAMDPVIQEVAVGMSGEFGEQGESYTVSGIPPLSLPNSLGKPLESWSVEVSPKQDLNGQDSPWPAGGSKNLFNPDTTEYWYYSASGKTDSPTARSVIIPAVEGDRAVVSFTRASADACVLYICAADANGDLIVGSRSGTTGSNSVNIASAPSGTAYIFAGFSNVNVAQNVQLEKGTAAVTEFVPYSNICPILGTDKLNIFVEEYYDPSAAPKAVITLPQTIYSGTINESGGESRWDEVDLGTRTWTKESTGSYYFFYADVSAKADNYNFKCSQYKTVEKIRTQLNNCDIGLYYNSGNYWKRLVIRDDSKSDMTGAQFKTAMEGVQLVYELADPVQLSITTLAVPTPTGTAATWATAEDGTVDSMEVTYVGRA